MPISSFLIRALLPSAAAAAATYQNGVYSVPLQPVHNAGYGVQCSVGTPPQSVTIPIDLGSSILALPSHNVCKDLSCLGSFDNTTSSTCKFVRGEATDLVFKDLGSLVSDTVHVGDLLVKNLVFGLLEKGSQLHPAPGSQPAYGAPPPASGSEPAYGAPPPASGSEPAYGAPPPASGSEPAYGAPPPASGSEPAYGAPPTTGYGAPPSTGYGAPPSTGYAPPPSNAQPGVLGLGLLEGSRSFLQQLKDLKLISKRVFSLYFAEDEAKTASALLIGAVDKAKQLGAVYELQLEGAAHTVANDLANVVKVVKITLETLNSDGKTYSTKPYSYPDNTYMPFDTSSFLWSLPAEIFTLVAQHYGVPNANPAGGFPVDCKYQTASKDVLHVDFGNNNVLGISLYKLVTKAEDGTCSVPISGTGSSFGLGFLKQVVTLFNYETMTVKISQVQHTSDSYINKV